MSIGTKTAAVKRYALGRSRRELLTGILFSLPYLAIFTVFLLYPLLKGLYMSLFDWNMLFPAESQFIGLENYQRLLTDPVFWNALSNTVYFVALTVPLIVLISLIMALGLNQDVRGKRILRFLYFGPYVLTVSVVAIIWQQMYSQGGLINTLLGGGESILASPLLAMPAIVIATVWWQTGFYFAILLAARQNVPERLYEAARLDGAGPWRTFRDITLPHLKNALVFVVIASTITQFQVFGQPYIMTKGGPVSSTETIVLYLYTLGFKAHELGFAAAVGYTLLLVLVGVSALNYYLVEKSS